MYPRFGDMYEQEIQSLSANSFFARQENIVESYWRRRKRLHKGAW